MSVNENRRAQEASAYPLPAPFSIAVSRGDAKERPGLFRGRIEYPAPLYTIFSSRPGMN